MLPNPTQASDFRHFFLWSCLQAPINHKWMWFDSPTWRSPWLRRQSRGPQHGWGYSCSHRALLPPEVNSCPSRCEHDSLSSEKADVKDTTMAWILFFFPWRFYFIYLRENTSRRSGRQRERQATTWARSPKQIWSQHPGISTRAEGISLINWRFKIRWHTYGQSLSKDSEQIPLVQFSMIIFLCLVATTTHIYIFIATQNCSSNNPLSSPHYYFASVFALWRPHKLSITDSPNSDGSNKDGISETKEKCYYCSLGHRSLAR